MNQDLKQLAQLHDENIELKKEIERLKGEITARVLLIKSEPDGIIRESMINNLLIDL